MSTTIEFLKSVKVRYNLTSDGQLAKLLGHTRSSISLLMMGRNYLGDEAAVKVAALLEIDPGYVIACIHAEREKNSQIKAIWQHIATLSIGAAAVALVFVALPFGALPYGDADIFTASTGAQNGEGCILCQTT